MPVHDLVLGTTNVGKARELRELLEPHGFRVRTLGDLSDYLDVVEDGALFADNARLKATQQARHLNSWVMADDSGIEIAALAGRPGVLSARYAGPQATDADNNAKVLAELAGLPPERRGARYVCHITVADPTGAVRAEASGECRGRLRTAPTGANGFGYDPLFEVIEYHRTFGELGSHVKAALSHRARAVRGIVPQLIAMAERGEWIAPAAV
ncbi:MAG: non-canonical purine NTP pyrophosphatase [Pirellulales bacterium]|nr:non-canonical purine NTP pyrophosphatase [Pirellulales bacterium]MBX3434413.1 non-canonical purine NTP pyrophosphatase [Pirellulales bacterium]